MFMRGDDSLSEGRGFDPGAVYKMDIWTFFTLICCKNCIVCLKRQQINKIE